MVHFIQWYVCSVYTRIVSYCKFFVHLHIKMATAVASRYAVLSVDVDDDYSNRKKKPPIQKPLETAKTTAAKCSKSETNLKKKKKPENVQVCT